jgi:hypothetical protein
LTDQEVLRIGRAACAGRQEQKGEDNAHGSKICPRWLGAKYHLRTAPRNGMGPE